MMSKFILIYGVIAGLVLELVFLLTYSLGAHGGSSGMLVGYLSMLLALSLVFVGVRRYRDTVLGGVIRFGTAFGLGLGIALIAAVFYVLGWETYLYFTHYSFINDYTNGVLQAKRAAGASAAELAKLESEMSEMKAQYAKPAFRMLMTLTEIAPVGLLVALISAAVLRRSKLP